MACEKTEWEAEEEELAAADEEGGGGGVGFKLESAVEEPFKLWIPCGIQRETEKREKLNLISFHLMSLELQQMYS